MAVGVLAISLEYGYSERVVCRVGGVLDVEDSCKFGSSGSAVEDLEFVLLLIVNLARQCRLDNTTNLDVAVVGEGEIACFFGRVIDHEHVNHKSIILGFQGRRDLDFEFILVIAHERFDGRRWLGESQG